jgi:hypothetical protein
VNDYGGDPLYRPMVLTDDSLWFVDGSANDSGTSVGSLIGMNTADGTVIQNLDLTTLYSGTEKFLYVNDLVASQGKLGLLVSVMDSSNPFQISGFQHPFYQDLYVFEPPLDGGG